jgi:hypothetical protein
MDVTANGLNPLPAALSGAEVRAPTQIARSHGR